MNRERPSLVRAGWVLFVILATMAALWVTRVVTVPLALALFVVVLAWPLQRWLEDKRVPRGLAYVLTLTGVLLVVAAFAGILYACVQNVANKAPEYEDRMTELQERARGWMHTAEAVTGNGEGSGNEKEGGNRTADDDASATGASSGSGEGDDSGVGDGNGAVSMESIAGVAGKALVWSYAFLGQVVLVVTFTVLGLIEVHRFTTKIGEHLRPEVAERVREVVREVGGTLQRYMLVRTIVSATTGVLVGLFTWAIGLDFPLVWAVSSFLLNYIPMLGSIVAVVPPALFALMAPEWWVFFATLGGLTAIQFTIGNFIDPRLEGRILALSPLVLFFSIVFWGWFWGIPGALMGIPLTATIVIVCRKFEGGRWLAGLLSK